MEVCVLSQDWVFVSVHHSHSGQDGKPVFIPPGCFSPVPSVGDRAEGRWLRAEPRQGRAVRRSSSASPACSTNKRMETPLTRFPLLLTQPLSSLGRGRTAGVTLAGKHGQLRLLSLLLPLGGTASPGQLCSWQGAGDRGQGLAALSSWQGAGSEQGLPSAHGREQGVSREQELPSTHGTGSREQGLPSAHGREQGLPSAHGTQGGSKGCPQLMAHREGAGAALSSWHTAGSRSWLPSALGPCGVLQRCRRSCSSPEILQGSLRAFCPAPGRVSACSGPGPCLGVAVPARRNSCGGSREHCSVLGRLQRPGQNLFPVFIDSIVFAVASLRLALGEITVCAL
ncbi:uncharacterized protein LOC132322389 isoform X1 [Haemorhous mexicanus]|uniref:uncharacterized protein LOC132322389 isoform X1 n=1 Tax=Haemorhous mexicanus TaxID=30427 RepID=UPI0028BEB1EC|nr:uncharacterized protein LOC132322389 isoform X1 [Haemorhous mexicanus]